MSLVAKGRAPTESSKREGIPSEEAGGDPQGLSMAPRACCGECPRCCTQGQLRSRHATPKDGYSDHLNIPDLNFDGRCHVLASNIRRSRGRGRVPDWTASQAVLSSERRNLLLAVSFILIAVMGWNPLPASK